MISSPLEQLVGECAGRHGAQVIDMVLQGSQHRPALEVFIDAEEGVSAELCSAVSREIAAALRVRPLLEAMAHLTVSSPGIDRPLRFLWQYRKHVGRDLAVRTAAEEGETEAAGRLVAVEDGTVVLERGKAGELLRIPFETIVRAVVTAPW